jgi:cell division topological specificity factor
MFESLKKYLFGSQPLSSKSLAKSRLHFVLVQDRTGLSNEELAGFKRQMVQVIERYFVIEEKGFDISYKRDGDLTTLVINSPVIVRRQESPGHMVGARRSNRRHRRHGRHVVIPPPAPPTDTTPEAVG